MLLFSLASRSWASLSGSAGDGTVGQTYSASFSASGGDGSPYTYGDVGGLPTGLYWSGSSIMGTPQQEGTWSFTVFANDRRGNLVGEVYCNVRIYGSSGGGGGGGGGSGRSEYSFIDLHLDTSATRIYKGIVGVDYGFKFVHFGNRVKKISGDLPDGLSINEETCDITGIPEKAGKYSFTVEIYNDPSFYDHEMYRTNVGFVNHTTYIISKKEEITIEILPASPDTYYNEGRTGLTEDDAFIIDSLEDFMLFCERVSNDSDIESTAYYKLDFPDKKIDLTNYKTWKPIGKEGFFTGTFDFYGHFDGNGHTVYMNVDNGNNDAALFGIVRGSVKNLTVSGNLKGKNTGGIAISNEHGIIKDCTFSGTLWGADDGYVGGIVAEADVYYDNNSTLIANCIVSDGTKIYGGEYAGGIIGYCNADGIRYENAVCIINNKSYASFENQVKYAGGIAGGIKLYSTDEVYLNNNQYVNAYVGIDFYKPYSYFSLFDDKRSGPSDKGCKYIGETPIIRLIKDAPIQNTEIWNDYIQKVSVHMQNVEWSAPYEELPENLMVASRTGELLGIPEETGIFTVTLTSNLMPYKDCTTSRDFIICVTEDVSTISIISETLPDAEKGKPYSATLVADVDGVTWSFMGRFYPSWLTLDPATGKITGTPPENATKSSTFFVSASKDGYTTATKWCHLDILQPLSITTTELPNYVISSDNSIYSAGFTSDVEGVIWTSSDIFPDWLTLDPATGKITGTTTEYSSTATSPGRYSFTVTASKENYKSVTKVFSLIIGKETSLADESFENAKLGTYYAKTLPYYNVVMWTVSDGALPLGLKLYGKSGYICGTPTTAGNYTFTLTAFYNDLLSVSKEFTITVEPASIIPNITIKSDVLPDGETEKDYRTTLSADVSDVTWSVSSGALPAGLTLNASTGVISGTPTNAGSYSFTITASKSGYVSDSLYFMITIEAQPEITINTTSLSNGQVGAVYNSSLSSSVSGVTWSISSGALPAGLTLDTSTGVISGTPTNAGSYSFTITASKSGYVSDSLYFMITIEAQPEITINTTSLSNGQVGAAYNASLSSNVSGVTWSVSSGALPAGLTLDTSTGVISGTPTNANNYSFTVTASKSGYTSASKSFSITIEAKPEITIIYNDSVSNGEVGKSYRASLFANVSKVTWSISSGALPAGLTLDTSTGVISGTPTNAGSYSFTITASKSGYVSDSLYFMITIEAQPEITINTTSLSNGQVGTAYNASLSSNVSGVTWSVSSGALPAGLTLDTSTGEISGTPTNAGTYSFTVTASKSGYTSAEKELKIVINSKVEPAPTTEPVDENKPVIKKYDLPIALINKEYRIELSAQSSSDVTWSAKKLPDGLTIDSSTGIISGVPIKAKTSNFTVTAENEAGKTSESFSISVYELPSIITASIKEGTVNKTYSSKFKANGSKPITWSAKGLPNGLSINPDNGTISGATSAFGTFPLTITAENPAGSDDMKINLIIHAIPPKISGKFDAGFLSEYYSSTITLSKGTEPIEWTLEGDLPDGLSFDKKTATLSGTPAQTWNGSLMITASNDAGVAQKSMSLKIKGTSPKVAGKFEKGNLNEPYSSVLTLSKGTLPVNFSFEGTLPNGLNFNPDTLTLSGTPSELWNDYITVNVSNGAGSYSKAFKIQIKGTAPKIVTSGLPIGNVNSSYSVELEATGSNPITWTAENLPDGLSLNGNRIEGTPSEECKNVRITVRASNPVKTVSKTFRLTVNEAVVEETSSPAPSEEFENNSEEISDKSEEIKPDENISEEKIIFGTERDASSVNMTVISEDYEIAAVLPEIHVTESGMYEIEVEISEDISAGRELIWLACPKNSEPSDDDRIAEFYDEEGNEITEVPENHKITVSAWFNEGVIYEPVIVVKF